MAAIVALCEHLSASKSPITPTFTLCFISIFAYWSKSGMCLRCSGKAHALGGCRVSTFTFAQ
jgi:hypothetical protein